MESEKGQAKWWIVTVLLMAAFPFAFLGYVYLLKKFVSWLGL